MQKITGPTKDQMLEFYIYVYTDHEGCVNATARASSERLGMRADPKEVKNAAKLVVDSANNTLSGIKEYGLDFLEDIENNTTKPFLKQVFPIINLDNTSLLC